MKFPDVIGIRGELIDKNLLFEKNYFLGTDF